MLTKYKFFDVMLKARVSFVLIQFVKSYIPPGIPIYPQVVCPTIEGTV